MYRQTDKQTFVDKQITCYRSQPGIPATAGKPSNDQRVQTTTSESRQRIPIRQYKLPHTTMDISARTRNPRKKKHSPREFGISCERNHAVITGNTRLSCEDSSAKCSFKHILRNESCDSKPWVRRLCRVNSFIVFFFLLGKMSPDRKLGSASASSFVCRWIGNVFK